jgi:predicted PurR-regulated permease PerM
MVFENPRYDILTVIVIFLILLTVFVIYFPLASPIILGMTLAVVLYPLHQRFSQRMKESASATLITLIAFLAIAIMLYFIVSILISGSSMVFQMVTTIVTWLGSMGNSPLPGASIGTALDTIVNALKQFLVPLLVNIPAMVFFTFVFFLSVFLFLLKGPAVSREIRAALPERLNISIAKISGLTVNTLYAIYIVTVEIAILTFLIALPVFYLLGYPGYLQLAI